MTQITAETHMRCRAGPLTLAISGLPANTETSLTPTQLEDGLYHVEIALHADVPLRGVNLTWAYPSIDVQASWYSGADRNRGLNVDWGAPFRASSIYDAPVYALYNGNGQNRMTFALADGLHTASFKAGLHEETGEFHCSISLFEPEPLQAPEYRTTLRLDLRGVRYTRALREVAAWWETLPGYAPATVPEAALSPMYSSWYNFHQHISPDVLLPECQKARELGCTALILDDGWQTSNAQRGYAYCGDWQPSDEKFPDMRAFVAAVHDLGMKVLLWYAVPYVGRFTKTWEKFEDKLLYYDYNPYNDSGVLDPLFPEVRTHLIETFERGLLEWQLDGFKLDFVDLSHFHAAEAKPHTGHDIASVPEAADKLLSDILERLRAHNPEVIVEFRQHYVGPKMRTYGNAFRAGDCPNDALQNRLRTLDVRLLAGQTAVHADPIMWHPEDTPEAVALQFINPLFAVPQLSVDLESLSETHQNVTRHWLAFWQAHREVLLQGVLEPQSPELLYPVVSSHLPGKALWVTYRDRCITLHTTLPDEFLLINARGETGVLLELSHDAGNCSLEIYDCMGTLVQEEMLSLARGIHSLNVPASGWLRVLR